MTSAGCAGVFSLHGQTILFTGKTRVQNQGAIRKYWGRQAELRGAIWVHDESRKVTILVLGDLTNQVVADKVLQRSTKVIFVHQERLEGHHICVIDVPGLSALCNGGHAACLTLERSGSSGLKASPS